MDVARYARQIALPEVGPEGQARICAARVAVIGADLAAETAALYLRAAGVSCVSPLPAPRGEGSLSPRPAERGEGQGEGSDVERWRALLADVDLVIRSGFDDDAMAGAATRLGLPMIVVRAQRDGVDMVVFGPRQPSPDATVAAPVAATATLDDGAPAVLAGTLAAVEALWILAGRGEPAPPIRHVRLPLDGREPLVQQIGRPS